MPQVGSSKTSGAKPSGGKSSAGKSSAGKPSGGKPSGDNISTPMLSASKLSALEISPLERALLEIIQTGFPLASNPYAEMAKELGLSQEEVFNLTQNLRAKGLIRRIGASFNARAMGWHSTLCAAKVPAHQLENFIELVNKQAGVTHNYLRNHAYNVWFTLIAKDKQETLAGLENISQKTGVKILNLPAEKIYKLKLNFKFKP